MPSPMASKTHPHSWSMDILVIQISDSQNHPTRPQPFCALKVASFESPVDEIPTCFRVFVSSSLKRSQSFGRCYRSLHLALNPQSRQLGTYDRLPRIPAPKRYSDSVTHEQRPMNACRCCRQRLR